MSNFSYKISTMFERMLKGVIVFSVYWMRVGRDVKLCSGGMLYRECETMWRMVCLHMLLWRLLWAVHMHDTVTEVGCPWGCSSCPYFVPAVWRENALRLWRHHRNTAYEHIVNRHVEQLWSEAVPPEADNPNHPIQWHERKRRRKMGEGRLGGCMLPWPLRVGLV